MHRINAVFAALALTALPATALAQKGEPPITELTERSGGVIEPERAALRLEHVDLDLEVDAGRKYLSGAATLTLTTRARQTRLLIDLDKNFHVSAVAIDGKALAAGKWRNPEGRLTIDLAKPVAAGDKVVARITYAGRPHEAVNAPWDDGFVWSPES